MTTKTPRSCFYFFKLPLTLIRMLNTDVVFCLESVLCDTCFSWRLVNDDSDFDIEHITVTTISRSGSSKAFTLLVRSSLHYHVVGRTSVCLALDSIGQC